LRKVLKTIPKVNIGIYCKQFDFTYKNLLKNLFDALTSHHSGIWLLPQFVPDFEHWCSEINCQYPFLHENKTSINDLQFMLILGGDGTFLSAINEYGHLPISFVGINTGRLGFLADIPPNEIECSIEQLASGKFTIEQRPMLEILPLSDEIGNPYALNEITVHKRESSSMITIHTHINDCYLASYWADGLIISTPTGSTAYSMSAGGPIISPASKNLVITPIASHNLTVRPLVINDDCEVKIKVESRDANYLLSMDSRSVVLHNPIQLTIRKSSRYISLIKFDRHSFFDTLRDKLMWGVDKRN
jgi:NAD+ kinase